MVMDMGYYAMMVCSLEQIFDLLCIEEGRAMKALDFGVPATPEISFGRKRGVRAASGNGTEHEQKHECGAALRQADLMLAGIEDRAASMGRRFRYRGPRELLHYVENRR
jgi:hypothetical protein